MDGINLKRVFLYTLIGSVALSAVLGIGVLLFGDFGEIEVRVLMTTLVVTVTSIFGLACGAYLESGRGKYLPVAGIVLSIISALMSFLIIWNALDDSEYFIKSFLTGTMLAASCSHLSLLSLARLDRRFSWTRIAAVVCVVLLCSILLYIMWFEPEGESNLIYRVLGVLAILLAAITVLTPVLHKLSGAVTELGRLEELDMEIADLRDRLSHLEAEREKLASDGKENS
jgi:membrane-associated HD superfamily phosphohydrolase